MPTPSPAEQALQLLFKKLHPLLEDTAHALDRGADASTLIRLHGKLQAARDRVCQILEDLAKSSDDPELADVLETLAADLEPLGEPFQQSLILTQLCLEAAPEALRPYVSEASARTSTWWPRMAAFLEHLEREPGFQAETRWATVDPDLGDDPDAS